MKNKELSLIHFEYNRINFTALVYKYASTAIILPDRTVLKTNLIILTIKKRNDQDETEQHVRQIFDGLGNLIRPSVLRKPGDWNKPLITKFPVTFAKVEYL